MSNLSFRLAFHGYVAERESEEGLQYVLLIVHDPVRDMVVGLRKQRGPWFLVGKLTFPGGKLEQGERLEMAASREMLEETGVVIAPDVWKFVARSSVVAVLAARSDDVLRARTCDSEPVFVMSVPRQLEYSARSPGEYAPDFQVLLEASLAALG